MPGHQHVGGERDQLFRILAHAREIAAAPAHIDPHVAADRPARLLQPLRKRGDAGLRFRLVDVVNKYADAPHALGCCARAASGHRRRAAENVMNSRRLMSVPKAR